MIKTIGFCFYLPGMFIATFSPLLSLIFLVSVLKLEKKRQKVESSDNLNYKMTFFFNIRWSDFKVDTYLLQRQQNY